jgi:hypothetical protein
VSHPLTRRVILAARAGASPGGEGIAVDKPGAGEGWPSRGRMYPRRRVQNLAPPGFGEGSELMRSCELALESIARKVALRRLGAGE